VIQTEPQCDHVIPHRNVFSCRLFAVGRKRAESFPMTVQTGLNSPSITFFSNPTIRSKNYSPSKRNYAKSVTWQMDI